MTFDDNDIRYMRRALALALNGRGHVSPNPMVGAVITAPDGRIIGEGWHRKYGGPHAEVNAVRSVTQADRALLGESTIYVTLEPCSHYGKTPPCALLLRECGFKRVVVACGDPNPRVAGRGIVILREAGISVDCGCLEKEAWQLNRAFMTAQTLRRPYVILKWACSADGFMDRRRAAGESAARFSTSVTSQMVHHRRACVDAIAVGAQTAIADNPRLNVRLLEGRSPRPVIFDRHGLVDKTNCAIFDDAVTIGDEPLENALHRLFEQHGVTSLLVEGGARLLHSFIDEGLWNEAFVEVAPFSLGADGAVEAPAFPAIPQSALRAGENMIYAFSQVLNR